MKKLLKKSIAGILVLVLCVGLLSTTALAVEDSIVVIREDTTIDDDFSIDGDLYIVEGAHLITTGEVTIYGNVYVFGSWRNTGTLTGEGTIHCLHYNSMSFEVTAKGHFTNTKSSGGRDQTLSTSVGNDYLSVTIPEGHTYDPETGETSGPVLEDEPDSEPEEEPDSEPEDEPEAEPEDTTDSGTTSSTGSAEHIYDFDNIVWQWTADYSAANAYVYCVDGDGAAKAYEAEIESYANEYGGTTYVATVVDENGDVYSEQIELDAAGNPIDIESGTDSTEDTDGTSGTGGTGSSGTTSSTGSAEHVYDFENIIWEWTSDYSAANAYVYCVDGDGAAKAYEADIESYANEYGGTTYVATIVDENGNIYSEQIDLDAAGNLIDVASSEISTEDTDDSGSGYTGYTGSTGSTGTGYTGSTGSTGSSGTGYTGSTGTSGTSGTSGTGTAAKTGDSAMPYLYLTLILAAGAAVVTFSVRRRVTRG